MSKCRPYSVISHFSTGANSSFVIPCSLFDILLYCALIFMHKEKILVVGASGQIGVELTLALRKIYGASSVVASDRREENDLLKGTGPYVSLDVMNKEMLHVQVIRQNVTQVYLLAAILS